MAEQLQAWSHQRRNRIILFLAIAIFMGRVLWVARGALIPYIMALVLGYLMLPLVNWLDRMLNTRLRIPKATRPLAILLTYLATAALVALFVSSIVPVLIDQFEALWNNREALLQRMDELSREGLRWYRQNLPEQMQTQIDDGFRRATGTVLEAIQTGATRTFLVLTNTVSFVLGTLVIPFWLFYLLNDKDMAFRALHHTIPDRYWPDFRNVIRLIDNVMAAYIRGQLLLSLSIGVMATVGLMLLGVSYPLILGVIAGLLEFLPFIGPILGAIPAVIVATVQQPILGLWTALFFLGIQQVENVLLAPRIAGRAVRLHPTVIMVVLVIGNEVGGLLGMLIVVPLTAVVRDVFRYLWMRFQDEPVPIAEAMDRLD